MDWSDEAVLLTVRRHGEGSALVTALTGEHGRHAGLVRGAGMAPVDTGDFHPVPEHLRHGRAKLAGVLRYVIAAAPDQTYTCHELFARDDLVAARTTWAGHLTGEYLGVQGNGKAFAVGQHHTFRVRNGRFVDHWAVRDDLSLFRQVGLPAPS